MEAQPASCQCTFEDQCSCEGALKFMECIKKSCDSGECNCIEKKKNTNHFAQACSAMKNECSEVGLTCGQTDATCDKEKVAWDAGAELKALKVKAPEEKKAKKAKKAEDKKEPAKKAKEEDPDHKKVHMKITHHADKMDALHHHGHRNFAFSMISAVVLGCVTCFLMNSSNAIVVKNTYSTLDFVVINFLALAWFIVVTHSLDYFQEHGIHRIVLHTVITIVFLLTSLFVSFRFRADTNHVAIFNGIFGGMIIWVNAGFVQTIQQGAATATEVAIRTAGIMGWYSLVSFACYFLMKKTCQEKWGDDTVDGMAGAALASGFVAWAHMVVTGTFHSIGGEREKAPTGWQTMTMLGLSLVYLVFGIVVAPAITKRINPAKYWIGRSLNTVVAFLGILPYFSVVLSLGHLIIDNLGGTHGVVQAQLHLALVSTAVGIFLILVCAYVPAVKKSANTSGCLVGLGGFMTGVAWSGLLDNSISMMLEHGEEGNGYPHPFIAKIALTAFLTAFIFPTYCLYLKPAVMAKGA